jgi:Tol biopolymer transport system component
LAIGDALWETSPTGWTLRRFPVRLLSFLLLCLVLLSVATAHAAEWQLTTTAGDNMSPAWCNGWIAFQSGRNGHLEMWAMDQAGEATNVWRITTNPANTDENPTWNATCSHIYYQSRTTGTSRLYYISKVGPPAQPIPVSLGTGDDEAPEAGPAGVVFHSDESGHDDIMWMPLGGESASTFLTDAMDAHEDRYPCWSPTDTLVAFASDRSGNWDIWLMHADGEAHGLWQLTSDLADETEPAFSPDGNLLAFRRDGVGIVAIDVVSRAEHAITSDPTDTQPCWAPDGSEIAFTRGITDRQIWGTDAVPDTGVEQAGSWGAIKAIFR